MLVNSKQLLQQAKQAGCAIPAVNVFNLAGIRATVAAAEQAKCPLILSLAEVHLPAMEFEEIAYIARYYAEKSAQKIVLHYDHGFTPALVKRAIDSGFTSVMIDGSSLSMAENIRVSSEIVKYAHAHDVSVEGEIGHVGGGESDECPANDESTLTTVEEAAEFAAGTGIDSLAVSVGTAHGKYKGIPKLDFQRLQDIAERVDTPLVLHGGSGSGDDNLNKAAQLGICKINLYTDIATAAVDRMQALPKRDFFEEYIAAQHGIKECLLHYYEVFRTGKGVF